MIQKFWGCFAMVFATVIWGFAFSAQSSGMAFMGPLTFTALRSIIAVFSLIAVILILDLCRKKGVSFWGGLNTMEEKLFLIRGGIFCGLAVSAASVCQQWGLKFISAGKTGFLTALYIVIVPLLGILFKRKTTVALWIGVFLALGGSYLLCGSVSSVGPGECLVIGCAFLYSIHILVIDHYAPRCDCVRLSCIQFIVASLLTVPVSLMAGEIWSIEGICKAMVYLLFCGAGSSAIAFTLQMVCQKYVHPVTASLLMSLESVFAVLGGYLFLKERLSLRELLGCAVILAAILISQIPLPAGKGEKKELSQ
ncbi:MAG: DMT family transporter [Lentisphaeria bacterium]|nr:DMT family transporter [Lentisphaeria bacterium]